jgi:predicted ferric reductase
LAGYSFGFLITTLIKWLISIVVFGNEIWITIKDALGLRLSSGSSGLNGPLSDYSSTFSGLPLSLRAIALNFMVFASKFIDPRNASVIGILLSFTLIIIFIIVFIVRIGFHSNFTYLEYLAATPILLIPFFYYAVTPNHSFNHAVLSYRAIPISLGFILSLIYLGKIKNNFSKQD